MRIQYLGVVAMLAVGVAVSVADEASVKPVAVAADAAAVVEPAVVEGQAVGAAAERPSQRRAQRRDVSLGDSIHYQTMLLRVLEEPDARKKIGLAPDVQQALVTAFAALDKQILAKRADLGYLQATQAKLIVDGAGEADVMAAVDAVWKARAEIAKFQTAKLLKMRSVLSKEQIQSLDEVRQEIYRSRRMEQLREPDEGRKMREERKVRPKLGSKREQPVEAAR